MTAITDENNEPVIKLSILPTEFWEQDSKNLFVMPTKVVIISLADRKEDRQLARQEGRQSDSQTHKQTAT
jgi:hypothetical protein